MDGLLRQLLLFLFIDCRLDLKRKGLMSDHQAPDFSHYPKSEKYDFQSAKNKEGLNQTIPING